MPSLGKPITRSHTSRDEEVCRYRRGTCSRLMPTIEPLRALDTLPPMGSVGGMLTLLVPRVAEPESRIDLIGGRLTSVV
jgi:hypothetical protein